MPTSGILSVVYTSTGPSCRASADDRLQLVRQTLLCRTAWGQALIAQADAAKREERRVAQAAAAQRRAELEQRLLSEREARLRR